MLMYKKMMKTIEEQGKSKLVNTMRKVTRGLLKIKIDVRRKVFKQILEALGPNLRMFISGGAAISVDATKAFRDIGINLLQGYGLTETSPVIAAEAGEVIICTYDTGGYGYYIAINHGNGYITLYGHLNEQLVSVGQRVARGERIALSGNTGGSTGPHLHFEVRYLSSGRADAWNFFYNAEVKNPLDFV